MPNDPLVAGLNPFQVETYRIVMYEQERERREYLAKFVGTTLDDVLPYIADLIVAKLAAALNGEDYGQIGREDPLSVNTASDQQFFKNLVQSGLTEEDLKKLRKEGVDLTGLATSSYETM